VHTRTYLGNLNALVKQLKLDSFFLTDSSYFYRSQRRDRSPFEMELMKPRGNRLPKLTANASANSGPQNVTSTPDDALSVWNVVVNTDKDEDKRLQFVNSLRGWKTSGEMKITTKDN